MTSPGALNIKNHVPAATLLSAASNGSISDLKAIVQNGVDINIRDYDGRTALHLAASEGHLELVKILCEEMNADLNPMDRWGHTPLSDALKANNADVATYLSSKGATLTLNPHEAGRELCRAACEGSIATCEILLNSGISANEMDYNGRTAIHLASMTGEVEIVKLLLKHNADVNTVDRFGMTPLQDAIKTKNYEIAGLLSLASTEEADLKQYKGSDRFTSALYQTVNLLCEKNNWDYGTGWILNDSKFVASEAWFAETRNVSILAAYRQDSEKIAIPYSDSSFIAKAARSGKAEWVSFFKKRSSSSYELNSSFSNMGSMTSDLDYIDTKSGNINSASTSDCDIDIKLLAKEKRNSLTPVNSSESLRQSPTNYPNKVPVTTDNSSFEVNVPHPSQLENPESQFITSMAVPVKVNNVLITILEFRSFGHHPVNADIANYIQSVAERMLVGHMRHIEGSSSTLRGMFADQINEVYRTILACGIFTESVVRHEVEWYYSGLGLHEVYWRHFTPQQISKHVMAFITSKLQGQFSGTAGILRYIWEDEKNGIYIYPQNEVVEIDRKIESKWFLEGNIKSKTYDSSAWGPSVKQFLSEGFSAPNNDQRIVIAFVSINEYVSNITPISSEETDLWKISSGSFLKEKDFYSRKRYQKAINAAILPPSPVVHVDIPDHNEEKVKCVVTVCYSKKYTHSFLSSVAILIQRQKLLCSRKYTETFANGLICYSLHLSDVTLAQLQDFAYQISATWILPKNTITSMVERGKLDLGESQWAYCGWKFVYHFISRSPEEWSILWNSCKDINLRTHLIKLKKRIHNEVNTESRIFETIEEYPELITEIYRDFLFYFFPSASINTKKSSPVFNEEIWNRIKKVPMSEIDQEILRSLLVFNASILKTNFFMPSKTAISFRLNPSFLSESHYPVIPYGVFFVLGAEFRGFHVRFDDVARGGLRLIKSRTKQLWIRNAEGLFDENYNLAFTQTLKNKDIPESGSKGTIFLSVEHQEKDEVAFCKYIDAILDLLQPSHQVVDYYEKPEILFMGPDEGTAGFMDWAALHARRRDWKFWSSFTTGKSQKLGGIRHDLYGMTTNGIHEYVLGILNKLGLEESSISKVQTGGPDGDLGSNEIKISKDKTIAIVDGSGVLYDPEGLNRQELLRLAENRLTISYFDRSYLSSQGFIVLVDDNNITLPNGDFVDYGLAFRNNFHLHPLFTADLFVPCGGRPASVNFKNVESFFNSKKKPKFKFIVEGANLFFTQDARLKLAAAGVILIKDASANKGGVNSSSLEVLASLCMEDQEFADLMCFKNNQIPKFYGDYVNDALNIIRKNARIEFECLWRESLLPNSEPLCVLTDKISERINQLNYQIRESNLWNDEKLAMKVLEEIIPESLQRELGLEKILARLPKSYVDAILSSHLASAYVYSNGLMANEFAFYQYMQRYATDKLN